MDEVLTLNFDGGSRGNPGPAGIGVVVSASDGTPLVTLGRFIGHATNNVAEYMALIVSMEEAKKLGATATVSSGPNALREIMEWTEGRGADAVFEAVGIPATVDLAVRAARKGGAVTLVGNVAPKIDFLLQAAVTRELTLHGSCASRGEYPAALEMMARGALKPDALLSAVAPLAESLAI